MPRAKLPEYFKEYEITVSTSEKTRAMTRRFHDEKVSYHKRWIKGTLVSSEEVGTGSNCMYTTLKYVKGGLDGQEGEECREEEEKTELSS